MSQRVLVTGISGFIAKQVALDLLRRGYAVRGTVRSGARGEEVAATLKRHEAGAAGRLETVVADLESEAGWAEAMQGCAFVQHVAAPFPIRQPEDREALVPAAKDGSLRVLRAAKAAGVERVVMTSSMVAMMYRAGRPKVMRVGESDWTDAEWSGLSAYIVAKTRAERAAWDWAEKEGWKNQLVMVNPGLVLGPSLDARIGSSLEVVQLVMMGAYPAVPPVTFPVVDVREVSAVQVRAMEVPAAAGRRLIAAGETISMAEMARMLKEAFPERAKKIPTTELPALVVGFLALFDKALRSVLPDLGARVEADAQYVTELTGVRFGTAREAVVAAGKSLVEHGLV